MVPGVTARSVADYPEIMYFVFSHLDPDGHLQLQDVYNARQALAWLARTCRNFTRSASKILWKNLPGDQPLADLLCVLGIARRRASGRQNNNANVASGDTAEQARFELPIQLHPGLWFSTSEREAAERRWKILPGYNDRYVGI